MLNEGQDIWWRRRRDTLLDVANRYQNAYVYDLAEINAAARRVVDMPSVSRVLYAVKANFNREVLTTLADAGIDFDCVSPGEVERVWEILPKAEQDRILFTPNFAPRDEYEWAIREGIRLTLDNLYPLRAWPQLFDGVDLFVRIDPDQGGGHHEHVVTSGAQSKFGVPLDEIEELCALVAAASARVVGIHAHSGSGILDPENWHRVAERLLTVASRFPETRVLDLGGGFGVPARPGDPEFDLGKLDGLLTPFGHEYPHYEIWLEPGRYLVSGSGVLLTHVTQTKGKTGRRYVGVSTGINALIRPALYSAYHEIVNLSRIDEAPAESVTIVGPICESGDRLGTDRMLPRCEEGDVILIANAGAYGRVMASSYNLREIPVEVAI